MTSLVPFVQLDLPGPGGLPDGRYLTRGEQGEMVLVSELVGSLPTRGRIRGRKASTEEPGADPPQLPIRRVTQALAERFDSAKAAKEWLTGARSDEADDLVEAAIELVNRAIAAFRISAGDPHIHEIGPSSALVIRIGYGTGDEVAASRWTEAVKLPPGRRQSLRPGTEDMRAPQRTAALLSGRDDADPWELHALRAKTDLDAGRRIEAQAELQAAIASFDASPPSFAPNLREEIAGRLVAARDRFGRGAAISPMAPLAADSGEGATGGEDDPLADAVDLFMRLQNRRRQPPV